MLCFTPLILYAESNLLIVRMVQPEHQLCHSLQPRSTFPSLNFLSFKTNFHHFIVQFHYVFGLYLGRLCQL